MVSVLFINMEMMKMIKQRWNEDGELWNHRVKMNEI